MEIKEIYIKNFRNIGEEGAEIKLSPITIFTGCNSAGKSTAAKALLLLEAYLSDVKANNYDLINTPLDFSKVVKLGSFDSVINKASKSNGQEDIVLGYSFASAILVADIQVRLVFGKKDTDTLNNGWLKELDILIDSKEFLSISINNGYYRFDFKDEERLKLYVRCYKIRHICSLWREKKIDDAEIVEIDRILNKTPTYMKDEAIEKLRPPMDVLIAIERKLINDGIIRRKLRDRDRDKAFLKGALSLLNIVSSIEDIPVLSNRDLTIYNFENRKGERLVYDDIETICENVYENFKAKLDLMNTDPLKAKEYVDKQRESWKNYIQGYISSDSSSFLDFKRSELGFENFLNDINDEEHQDTAKALSRNASDITQEAEIMNIVEYPINFTSLGFSIKYLLKRILNPYLCGKLGYVDASTVDVKRLYPLNLSDSFGNLWKNYNDMKTYHKFSVNNEKGTFLRKWLKAFEICDDVIVENLEGMLRIKLISKDNPEGRLLADYGYGVTQLIALLLNIEIAINNCEDTIESFLDEPLDDGRLSIIPYRLILEEPEVHLHPCLQSQLADLFLDAYRHGVEFVVETHSEYLVRRTQVLVASRFCKNARYIPSFRVYYFPENGKPYDMGFQKNGYFKESFGPGFLDEAGKWTRELMRTNRR